MVVITCGEWFHNEDGTRDRYYSLERNPAFVAASPTRGRTIVLSKKSSLYANDDKRKEFEEKAARRRRLIEAGLYITESDLK